jgi:hypothetical protein
MFVKGNLEKYDDIVLPLSKQRVINLLKEIDSHYNRLSSAEIEFLCRMEVRLGMKENNPDSYLKEFPGKFIENFQKYNEKHLYAYRDSVAKMNIDLFGDITHIYSHKFEDYSLLLNLGGHIYGSYSDWLGFLVEGSNGTQYHNRQVAELDPRVKSSFTFNHTKINFFDNTQGYVRLQKDNVNLQLGRERILWGNGYVNRMILSDNPPLFDFLRFNISYKSLRYDFLHAWLVQPYETIHVDSITGDVRQKGSKYLAISRLGFNPYSNLDFGLTQMIIYANRPFEAAYLNPFLFWESAQRSLGDLDNSFLSFDVRYKIANGIETSGSMIWDDILFSVLFKGEIAKVNNRSAWQVGLMLTNPILPSNLNLKIEYLQIRPYTFSHPDIGEALTYTNNSYILGANIQPNSTALSAELNYLMNGNWQFQLSYTHTLHGNNYYDENGNLIRNVGGNIFDNLNWYSSFVAPLLDGDLEKIDNLTLKIQNEILYGIYLNLILNSSFINTSSTSSSQYSILSQLKFYFR